jgi:hypothetical protein
VHLDAVDPAHLPLSPSRFAARIEHQRPIGWQPKLAKSLTRN